MYTINAVTGYHYGQTSVSVEKVFSSGMPIQLYNSVESGQFFGVGRVGGNINNFDLGLTKLQQSCLILTLKA